MCFILLLRPTLPDSQLSQTHTHTVVLPAVRSHVEPLDVRHCHVRSDTKSFNTNLLTYSVRSRLFSYVMFTVTIVLLTTSH